MNKHYLIKSFPKGRIKIDIFTMRKKKHRKIMLLKLIKNCSIRIFQIKKIIESSYNLIY